MGTSQQQGRFQHILETGSERKMIIDEEAKHDSLGSGHAWSPFRAEVRLEMALPESLVAKQKENF